MKVRDLISVLQTRNPDSTVLISSLSQAVEPHNVWSVGVEQLGNGVFRVKPDDSSNPPQHYAVYIW